MNTTLTALGSHGENNACHHGSVITAVRRLFLDDSMSRPVAATNHPAPCFEVDQRAVQGTTPMLSADGCDTARQYSPGRLSLTRVM